MTTALVRFNVKCMGISANQDAGTQSKDIGTGRANLKPCQVEYFTENSCGIRMSVNDIITYGGGAFKTGLCAGYLFLEFQNGIAGRAFVVGVDSFTEVKKNDDAYFRFNFRTLNFRSTYFLENGP